MVVPPIQQVPERGPSSVTPVRLLRLPRLPGLSGVRKIGRMSDQTRDLPFGIDFGGSGIKGAPVDLEAGDFAAERVRIKTPKPSTPEAVAGVFAELLAELRRLHRLGGRDRARGRPARGGQLGRQHRRQLDRHRRRRAVHQGDRARRARRQRRRRRGARRGEVRRGDGPRWAGHRDHAGDGHRVGDPVRRRAGPELRARPPRDRRARRRGPRGELGQGAGGTDLPEWAQRLTVYYRTLEKLFSPTCSWWWG